MLIIRLIFLAAALFLIAFGIYPALEYTNPGALLMLALAILLLVITVFLRPISSLIRHSFLGKLLFLAALLGTAYFAAIQFLIITDERPPETLPRSDAIVVLGAGLTYGTTEPSLALSYRLDQALTYLEEYPDTPVIVSGGKGQSEKVSEAYAMQQYLVRAGVPSSQITLEDKSTSTAENLSFTLPILEENNYKDIAIITSDYHCFRATLLAERSSISATCIPAQNVWWLSPADHFREFLALSNALLRYSP